MAIRDEPLKIEQGHLVRKRHYVDRNATLEANKRLQSVDQVKPTDGLRAFANFPDQELNRLAAKAREGKDSDFPSYYADLDAPDAEIRSRAVKRLVASPDGKKYRVGKTPSISIQTPRKRFIGRDDQGRRLFEIGNDIYTED